MVTSCAEADAVRRAKARTEMTASIRLLIKKNILESLQGPEMSVQNVQIWTGGAAAPAKAGPDATRTQIILK